LRVLGIPGLFGWAIDASRRTGHEAEDMLEAHLSCGIREVSWHCARSTVFYHSDLPDTTLYDDKGDQRPGIQGLGEVYRRRCGLRAALRFADRNEMIVWGRVAMNRHYGYDKYGGSLTSGFAKEHPEWHEVGREGGKDTTRLCYAIPEVREERISILCELARIGVHGLQLDFCRQPPILRYHSALTGSFRERTGIDPLDIEALDRRTRLEWWNYRSEFLTLFMRELRESLESIRAETGQPLPVQARITDCGFDVNLAAGIDVNCWCREGLVQEICVNPLQWVAEAQTHDIEPYVELGRSTCVKVLGGAHVNVIKNWGNGGINPLVLGRRIQDLNRKGASGVALYQTDYGIRRDELGELLPLLHDPSALEKWLSRDSLKDEWPVTYINSSYGMDNHSKLGGGFHLLGGKPGI